MNAAALLMLLGALAGALAPGEARPSPRLLAVMADALAEADESTHPATGALAWDAALLFEYARRESHFQLAPRAYSWDAKAGLAHGVWQLHGPAGLASVGGQARAWLRMLREGARLHPETPSAIMWGLSPRGIRGAQMRELEAAELLRQATGANHRGRCGHRAALNQGEKNMTTQFGWQHYVLLGLGALGAACTYLAQTDPAIATAMHEIIAVDGALVTVLGILFPGAVYQGRGGAK
jgi:hypothetical protein